MENFKVYDSRTQFKNKQSPPILTVGVNCSTFRFNESAANLFNNKRVSFLQMENRPKDWYLVEDESGFLLSSKSCNSAFGYKFRCSALRQDFFNSLGLDLNKSYRFKVASQPTETPKGEGFAIITLSAYCISKTD